MNKSDSKISLIEECRCEICGSRMYQTHGGPTITLQCGSNEAMFWNFSRGTQEQKESHDHFIGSIINIPNRVHFSNN